MTTQDKRIVSLIGKRNKTVEEIGFINTVFHKAFNKKKNQIKRIVKKASSIESVYGWTSV